MSEAIANRRSAKFAARQEKKKKKTAALVIRREKAAKRPLNRFFHHIDRGSNLGREIASGLLMCMLGVCCIFMNMQLLSRFFMNTDVLSTAEMGESYASFWFMAMVTAFVGSMLMGLVARLPIIQVSGLGMSTVLISTLGLGSGLSYANLLAVCFVSSAVFTAICAVPFVRNAVIHAIPECVRKAMPAAVGLLVAFIAIQLTGLISYTGSALTVQGTGTVLNVNKLLKVAPTFQTATNVQLGSLFNFAAYNSAAYKGDSYYPLMQICLIAVASAFAGYCLLHKTKHPMLYSLLVGTGVYFAGYLTNVVFYFAKNGALQFELDSLWARLWMVGSEDAMHLHLPAVLSNLHIGQLLKEGFDFTAYTEAGGSVPVLMAVGILTNLALLFGQSEAVLAAEASDNEKSNGRALLCCGIANLVAPVLGQPMSGISCISAAGKRDGGRSGIAAIVAALGFLASAFVWLFPFIFATTTSYNIQFNMYGHYGVVLAMLADNSFLVVDAVMVLIGLAMASDTMKHDWTNGSGLVPMMATVGTTLALSNPAIGLAAGCAAHLLVSIFDRERKLTIGNIVAATGAAALIVLTIL